MSAPTHDPLVVNTADGSCWVRRASTRDGRGLYALSGAVAGVPELVLAPLRELAELGLRSMTDVLPVPVGGSPELTRVAELEARIAELEEQRDRRRVHLVALQNDALSMRGSLSPNGEDCKVPFALGETLTPAVDWLIARVAELEVERHTTNEALSDATVALREREAAPLTVYRASHDSIVMGLYTTAAEARRHCETVLRREYDESTKVSLWWRDDEGNEEQPQDGEAELIAHVTPRAFPKGRTWYTGYVVTSVTVSASYDEGADE